MLETKSRSRAPARRAGRAEFTGGGILAGLADRAFENPAMSGGLVVMALTAAAIVSNAMFLQGNRHPDPIFSTRPDVEMRAAPAPAAVPIPRSRADHVGSIAPTSRPSPDLDAPAASPPPPALIADLQKALAGKGLYRGTIDGRFGSRTRAAIAAFEEQEGLIVTGLPTTSLLTRARTVAARAPEPVTVRPREPVAVAKPPAATAAAEPDAAVLEQARYQRVQAALNSIGYGPVKVDGRFDDETANAIRRFELDNGLPLKGTANDRVIARLIKIGAMPPS